VSVATQAGISPERAVALAHSVGKRAQPFAVKHDRQNTFVAEGYQAIRDLGYGALAVPADLGGGGADLRTICNAQQALAGYCASTALGIAMHQHAVLSLAVRARQGDDDIRGFLSRIATEGILLSSSGTVIPSNPGLSAAPTTGGLLVSGRRPYASGCIGADLLFALAGETNEEWIVNVAIPMGAAGVEVQDDWHGMGMRGSGSNSVVLNEAFVPDDHLFMRRPWPRRGRPAGSGGPGGPGHGPGVGRRYPGLPLRIHGLMIALPVITATYLGVAEAMYNRAVELVQGGRRADDPVTYRLLGDMTSQLHMARWSLDAAIEQVTDDALGSEDLYVTIMIAKRHAILAGISIIELAMEMLGAMSYTVGQPFEQALRDVRAGITHPLPPEATLASVGRSILVRAAIDHQGDA
jgi:alkylation response protein AidB-like acyl-CoA dehydrogenase